MMWMLLTWIETAFHVFPYPVLDGTDKLAGANLRVHLGWKNKAHLRPGSTLREQRRTEQQVAEDPSSYFTHHMEGLTGDKKADIQRKETQNSEKPAFL